MGIAIGIVLAILVTVALTWHFDRARLITRLLQMRTVMAAPRRARRLTTVVVVASATVPMMMAALWIWPQFVYGREHISTEAALSQLLSRRPHDVNAEAWEVAATSALIAYNNVCFSANHVPLDELRSFHADVKDRLDDKSDLGTMDWIWQRLAETGPHGQAYCARFEAQYRASLNAALGNQ